jgi:YHS domain-containing protein
MGTEICDKCELIKRLNWVERYHGVVYTYFCNNDECIRFEEIKNVEI